MSPALRRTTRALVLLWWLPSIVVVFTPPVLFRVGFKLRARRARRLMEAGDMVEADRVVARLRRDAERYRRWAEAKLAREGCSSAHGQQVASKPTQRPKA